MNSNDRVWKLPGSGNIKKLEFPNNTGFSKSKIDDRIDNGSGYESRLERDEK